MGLLLLLMVVLGAVGEEEGGLAHLQWTPVADRSVSHNPSFFHLLVFVIKYGSLGDRKECKEPNSYTKDTNECLPNNNLV